MFEILSNYSAQIIAACALLFATYHASQQRKHNKLSVKPHISSFVQSNRTESECHIRLELHNNGLGPAFINNFKIYLDNEPTTFSEVSSFVSENIPCNQGFFKFNEGSAFPVGEVKHIIYITFSNEYSASFEKIYKRFNRINLSVDYECAYGIARKFDNFV